MLNNIVPAVIVAEHNDVIFKPLDGMGGTSIFKVRKDDPNLSVIIETFTQLGTRTIMAQRYLPEIYYVCINGMRRSRVGKLKLLM